MPAPRQVGSPPEHGWRDPRPGGSPGGDHGAAFPPTLRLPPLPWVALAWLYALYCTGDAF